MDVLIATKNAYKVDEMVSLLEGLDDIKIHLLKDQDFEVEIEEDGRTLKQNAQKKAIEISKRTKFLTFASDGGVDIPGLGSSWNYLKSQRIVGQDKTDIEKAKTLLNIMVGLKDEERRAEYRFALALAMNGRLLWIDEKVTERGYITEELVDEDIPEYRWMGHIWYYEDFGKVFNKLNENELIEVRKQSTELKEKLQKFLQTYFFSSRL